MLTRATGHTRVRNKSSSNLDVLLHQTRSHNTQTQLGVMRAGIFANKQREHTNQPRDCLRVLSPRRSPRRGRLTPHPLSFSSALLLSFSLALLLSAGHTLVCTRHALTSNTQTQLGVMRAGLFANKHREHTNRPRDCLRGLPPRRSPRRARPTPHPLSFPPALLLSVGHMHK